MSLLKPCDILECKVDLRTFREQGLETTLRATWGWFIKPSFSGMWLDSLTFVEKLEKYHRVP